MSKHDNSEPDDQLGFITRDAESPDRVDVPIWVVACVRCAPPLGRTGRPMDADKVLVAAYILLADRIRHASGGVQLNRDRLARLVGYTSGKRVGWILDYLAEIGFLVIHRNYNPSGGRNPDTFDVYSRPPANYVGPRTYAELVKAADEGWPTRDSLFVDLGKTAPEKVVRSAPVTELRPSHTTVSREDVRDALRTVGWNAAKAAPSAQEFETLVDLAHAAITRYGATLDQVRWYAARKVRESTSNPPVYVMKAFKDHAAEVAREPDPRAPVTFEDDPELAAAFARKDTARDATRAAAEVGQSGMSVEEADEQIRAWYAEGGAGANAAARLLGTSWPCPDRDDYGTSPEQAMAYYADRDERAREWIKAHYDELVAALTSQRVA